MDSLTQKETIFCHEYILKWNGTEAYMKAYPNVKNKNSAGVLANKLLRKVKIANFIEEIQKDLEKLAETSRLSTLRQLDDIIENAEKDSDKIKAIELKNKMLGYNAPKQTENKTTHKFELSEAERKEKLDLIMKLQKDND